MTQEKISIDSERIQSFCEKHHIDALALFGSILTEHFNEESDVDILVRFDSQHIPHLLEVVDMESELATIFGRSVDLKTPNDLSPYFRKNVMASTKLIYGRKRFN